MLPLTCRSCGRFEVEFFESCAVSDHYPGFLGVGGIDKHALWHCGQNSQARGCGRSERPAGDAVLCGKKLIALRAGSVWDHCVAEFLDRRRVGKHARLRVHTICIARRCDPARRQELADDAGVRRNAAGQPLVRPGGSADSPLQCICQWPAPQCFPRHFPWAVAAAGRRDLRPAPTRRSRKRPWNSHEAWRITAPAGRGTHPALTTAVKRTASLRRRA